MTDLLNLADLTPMQVGRIRVALEKRFRFDGVVMTLGDYLASRQVGATKRVGNHSHEYNRTRFNRMNGAEQREYEKRLARPSYTVWGADGFGTSVPKIVFDALNIPEA